MKINKLFLLVVILLMNTTSTFSQEEKSSQDQNSRLAHLQKRLQLLNAKKIETLLQKTGKPAPKGFFDCLCIGGKYGSSIARQYYHPGVIGKPDKRYSCQQVGPPCIVSNNGCLRYPLPGSTTVWNNCIASKRYEDGTSILVGINSYMNKMHRKQPEIGTLQDDNKLKIELMDCKKKFEADEKINEKMQLVDGLDYLKKSGVPLLDVPVSISTKANRDLHEANKLKTKELAKKEKQLKKNLDKNLKVEILKNLTKNKENYALAAKFAKQGIKYKLLNQQNKYNVLKTQADLSTNKKDKNNIRKQLEKLNEEITQSKTTQSNLNSFIRGVDVAGDVISIQGVIDNANSKNGRKQVQAGIDSIKMVQKYFKQYKDQFNDFGDFKKFTEENMKKKDFDLLMKNTKLVNELSGAVDKTVKIGEFATHVYDNYQKYKKIQKKAQTLYNSGRYTDAQAHMLTAFDAMSVLANKASAYMPPGMDDMVKYYAEALKTPAKFDQLIRNIVNSSDVMAEYKGDQAHLPVMKKYLKQHNNSLNRDDYLFRKAGLSIYQMDHAKDPHSFVVMADSQKDPQYLSNSQYLQLKKMVFYFPIVHKKRMQDSDLYQLLVQLKEGQNINLIDIEKKANTILKDAALNNKVAGLYGKKTITKQERYKWDSFRNLMLINLPYRCALDSTTQKKLFNSYSKEQGQANVEKYIINYGKKLKSLEKKSKNK